MTTVRLTATGLDVRFTAWEKALGLVRDVRVPLAAITGAEAVPAADSLAAVRGLRAPGLGVPGVRRLGTWRGRGRKALVSVRRGQPALRVRLTGQPWDELLLGTDDAAALAAALGR
ncbi:hypothetical protein LO771_12735 [Streptacidiphilus sp. ASG 303]|uniref:hypothetical protein n=1 Tax=Streptacidiphilus sp. ASG 303 TaxID=2896847 RepID=UPI001E4C26D6|nr:hypothetical protein [Streptacidiphilus sp. ASG 303]MCD0483249.1 hypothetical protein [Streptacidiphilus sp. ASG 303]